MGAQDSNPHDLVAFADAAGRVIPVDSVGVLFQPGNETVSLLSWRAKRLSGYRFAASDVPAVLLPSDVRQLVREDLDTTGGSVIPQIVGPGPGRVLVVPLGAESPASAAWIATPSGDPLTAEHVDLLRSVTRSTVGRRHATESPDAELARLRRCAAAEEFLTTLIGVLDLREVFAGISQITSRVLNHDAITVLVFTEDGEYVVPYAIAGSSTADLPPPHPLPDDARRLLREPWEFEILDDLQADPKQPRQLVAPGYRSLLRVPVRLQGRLAAVLAILSTTPHHYALADVPVAQRIADYVALGLSHQRLAEQARQTEELRARAETLEVLDGLLAELVDTADLPEVFDRVSAIARKVLAHDAMVLSVVLPDRHHVRVYASTGAGAKLLPEVLKIPDVLVEDPEWEHVLSNDLQVDPVWQHLDAAKRGYRSAIRVAVRLDGELFGAVAFLSFTPALYKPPDLLVARRIRDRLALNLTRGRGTEAAKRAEEATARARLLESRVRALTEELNARAGYRRIVGDALPWRLALTQATQVAATDTTVLLLGESGTGKEVVARFIHRASPRADGPFVALNCAALPEQLLEAELFGYERGAFTGATQSKPGQLELAAGGILFLDEVGEMSVAAQSKFLRVLEQREFQRLGGTRVLKTDARIVAATNRDLPKAIERGQFREDLYYRLHVFTIHLPPLRDRRDDVLPLSEAFIGEISRSIGRPPAGISREARRALLDYHWPGNVRELRNILERAAILCDGGLIAAEHLAFHPPSSPAGPGFRGASAAVPSPPGAPGNLLSVERAMIEQALRDAHFNKSEAARALGLTRAQLYVRLRKHGIEGYTPGAQ